MNNLFSWVDQLAEFILSLFPHLTVVNRNEVGIKYSRGKVVRVLGPGIHWYWPVVTEEPTVACAVRQVTSLSSQKLTTLDDECVAICASVVYEVADPVRAIVETEDYEETVAEMGGAALVRSVTSRTWEDLCSTLRTGSLESELMGGLRPMLDRYGLLVREVRVTDCVPTFALSLIGDGFLTSGGGGDDE